MPSFARARSALLLILPVLLAAQAGPAVPAADRAADAPKGTVVLTLFWGEGCPHCEKEKAFLKDLRARHPGLSVREYEVWKHRENAALFRAVLRSAGVSQAGVPATVVGVSVFMGFAGRTRAGIEAAVERCLREGCPDGVALLGAERPAAPSGREGAVRVPLLGTVDPARVSLPVFTVVVAGLDSFNPCAFFVLLFLLSLLVRARSRGRMLLIGSVFVLFSGLVYFVFMAAWLTVFMIVGGLAEITAAGGAVALVAGGINVKDFFFFRRGVSLTIADSAKPKLFERMRGLLRTTSLPALLAAAAVLALSANAYELLCTAGFPMVYTRVLTLHGLTAGQYYRYLALYNAVYVLPLAVIVLLITATLGARKLTEWQGRKLKLLSGLMMMSLGMILIAKPELLNNAAASAGLLAAVIIVSWTVISVTKKVRPGITA